MSKKVEVKTEEVAGKYTAKILDVSRGSAMAYDNAPFLDVHFGIYDGETMVAERRRGFAIDTSEETIIAEVKQYCIMLQADEAGAAEAKKRSEAEAGAAEIINNLSGKTL
jgi:hypothetical protein